MNETNKFTVMSSNLFGGSCVLDTKDPKRKQNLFTINSVGKIAETKLPKKQSVGVELN